MVPITATMPSASAAAQLEAGGAHPLVIATLAFLTVADLFAAQAVLPELARTYEVGAAAMGSAVNASTVGMAVAALAVARFSRSLDRRRGVMLALALLAVPTALLAAAPNLAVFTGLRVLQGLCMATAFTLTLAYLAEQAGAATQSAVAAYITGNVASNLIGRLLAATVADLAGLTATFLLLAALNLAGAALAWQALGRMQPRPVAGPPPSVTPGTAPMATMSAIGRHLADPRLVAAFAVGFAILFAFIGTFTYVNFVLVRPPLSLAMMSVGLVYLVFLPAVVTTPLAARVAAAIGTRAALWCGLAIAAAGLPCLLAGQLAVVLAGLTLVGIGTFLAQATAAAFVGRAASTEPGAASGLYLASYFLGGLIGSIVLGQVFDRLGWTATVAGIGLALAIAALLASRLSLAPAVSGRRQPV